MDKALEELIWLSKEVGKDKELAVGTGGNTSAKTQDLSGMYIKASGAALGEMSAERGWREVSRQAVLDLMVDPQLLAMDPIGREAAMAQRLVAVCIDGLGEEPRPSVEATLHAVVGKYGVHLHALPALAYVCANDGEQRLRELFAGEREEPLWVPYSNPGTDLGIIVNTYYHEYLRRHSSAPEVMFFEKHGMMVCCGDVQKAFALTQKTVEICQSGLGKIPSHVQNPPAPEVADRVQRAIARAYEQIEGGCVPVNFYIDPVIELYFGKNQAQESFSQGPMTPDEIGFIEDPVFIAESALSGLKSRLAQGLNKNGKLPKIVFVEGTGLFITGDPKFAGIVKDVFTSSLYVRHFASQMGGLNVLTPQQEDFVRNWEGEKYRVKRAAPSG